MIMYAAMQELSEHLLTQENRSSNNESDEFVIIRPRYRIPDPQTVSRIIAPYISLLERIEEWGLGKAYNCRPLMDGREIISFLNMCMEEAGTVERLKPGRWLSTVLDNIIQWQFENDSPEQPLTKADCQQFLLRNVIPSEPEQSQAQALRG